MNFKSGSVRVASLFGRLAVFVLASPPVGIAIRAAASAVCVVARRFVRRPF